ncbi:MAG: hypothetical protein NT079_02310 [Candidatus Omnitrophica bacterium]|nr:hypothetical protein [Candidatus Omnitrophota bacterium]
MEDIVTFGGSYSALNTVPDLVNPTPYTEDYYGSISQSHHASATPGQVYYAAVQAKSLKSLVTRSVAGLQLCFLDEDFHPILNSYTQKAIIHKDTISGGGYPTPGTPWRQLYIKAEAPPLTKWVKTELFSFASIRDNAASKDGKVYFDNVVLSTTPIPPPPEYGKIENRDFENGIADSWELSEPALNMGSTQPITWKSGGSPNVFSGSHAAMNSIPSNMILTNLNDYNASLSQDVAVTEGTPVFMSAMVKTTFNDPHPSVPNHTGAKAGIRIDFFDKYNKPISHFPSIGYPNPLAPAYITEVGDPLIGNPLNTDWHYLEICTWGAPVGTAKIGLALYVWAHHNDITAGNGSTKGDIYFDDINLDCTYINYLGYHPYPPVYYVDLPQETATQAYYTGPAAMRMTLQYLFGYDPENIMNDPPPTQDSIYTQYHLNVGGTQGQDMNSAEIKYAMNQETNYFTFHFENWFESTPDGAVEDEAIKNFIYWMDYTPPYSLANCPAFVPVNGLDSGTYQWRLVRGFAADKPAYNTLSNPGAMNDFTLIGLWVNDPSSPGIGFNIYQTPDVFKADYKPINGKYLAVYDPPMNSDLAASSKKIKKAKMTMAAPTPNAKLKNEILALSNAGLSKPRQLVDHRPGESSPITLTESSFSKEYIKEALPIQLRRNPVFRTLFAQVTQVRAFEVVNIDRPQDSYFLVALDAPILPGFSSEETESPQLHPNQALRKSGAAPSSPVKPVIHSVGFSSLVSLKTTIVLAFSKTGAFREATWVDGKDKGEIYPKVNNAQAEKLAQSYFVGQQTKGFSKNAAMPRVKSAQPIYSSCLGVSRFFPVWRVIFEDNQAVDVSPKGICSKPLQGNTLAK